MTNILLISILIVGIITMIASIISMVVITKSAKQEDFVKKLMGIVGIVFIVVAVIIGAIGISNIKSDVESIIDSNITLETAGFNEVTIDEYLSLINEDKQNIILVARPTCGYCEKFTPILKQAKDDMKLTINYVNTDKFSSEDWEKFEASLDYFSNNEWGTPLVLITKNNDVIADNGGYVELKTIKEFFKANGYGE